MTDITPQSDLQELFSRDPLKHTKDSITEIITTLRASAAQYNLGNQRAGKVTPKKTITKSAGKLAGLGLNLKIDLKTALTQSVEEGKDDEDKA